MSTHDEDEILDGLTATEREGIAELEAEEREVLGADDDEGEGGMEAGDPEEEAGKEGGTTTVEEAADLRFQPVPLIKGEAVEDVDKKIEALRAQEDEIAVKFDDGDMTAKEYKEALRKLQAEQDELKEARLKARLSVEISEQEAERRWNADCEAFLKEHSEIVASNLRLTSFDTALKLVTGDEANSGLTNAQQLQKAYDTWVAELGFQPTKPTAKAKEKEAEEEAPRRERTVVPTLARVPVSDREDMDGGRFAALDRIFDEKGPDAHEAALARLSPSEREAYLRQAA